MTRRKQLSHAAVLAATATWIACGGDAPAADAPETAPPATPAPAAAAVALPDGPLTVPEWFAVDETAGTVTMTVTAGSTSTANYWNYYGAVKGEMAIEVPLGYEVSITFVNSDPAMAHSLGVSAETKNFALPPAPTPVFPGAITQSPTSMLDGTLPGESETISFVASEAGTYTLVCYIPGHSAVGMWVYFVVSEDGSAGVRTQ